MLPKRNVPRTYAKRTLRVADDATEPALKKRRVEADGKDPDGGPTACGGLLSPPPSSPSRRSPVRVLHDENHDSVPSPPPRRIPASTFRARRSAFSILRKHRVTASMHSSMSPRAPLADIANARLNDTTPLKKTKKRLTQMQIDLGGEVKQSCRTCGMEYIPSNEEDLALHKRFHGMNLGGVDFGKALVRDAWARRICDAHGQGPSDDESRQGFVVSIDGRSLAAERNRAKKVLQVANAELSAVDIEDGRLWGQMSEGVLHRPTSTTKDDSVANSDAENLGRRTPRARFKIFLYIENRRCVGLCLVERIARAYKVLGQAPSVEKDATNRSSVSISSDAEAAIMGISRIWTSKSHRGKGIARLLLDSATRTFAYGMEVPKHLVAFSQPTESGGHLAAKWFGQREGWKVYVEE
ncbi:MAG: N-acetyltransferase O1 (Establishment of cohesion protein 1) [Piccolia ochrophora]|nr:MAG: N-acetyltransferase O1 (Establishment of cohesion protein 1) [Piccolia ochrophora]